MRVIKSIFTIFMVTILISIISAPVGSATAEEPESLGLGVRPAKLEMQAAPGTKETKTITVTNVSEQELTVKVSVYDFEITTNNILNYYRPGDASYSCAQWVDIGKKVFTLGPKKSQDVNLTLVVPKNVEPGGHYASVTFTSAGKPSAGEVKVHTAVRLGVLILATSRGPLIREGKILSFRAFKESFWHWTNSFNRVAKMKSLKTSIKTSLARPVFIRAVFENRGNVHLNLKGTLRIKDFFGKTVFRERVPEYTVLPKTKRYIDFNWKRPPLLGKFSGQLNIKYAEGKTKTKKVSFYIFSWLLIVLIVFAIFSTLVLFFTIKALRLRSRRKLRLSESTEG